jgi:hypothetical protein
MGLHQHTVCFAFVHLPHTFWFYNRATVSGKQCFKHSPGPLIRLMVDVLLTMNEASCYAGGRVFLLHFLADANGAQGISEKKHD